jgi:hypothetical protein
MSDALTRLRTLASELESLTQALKLDCDVDNVANNLEKKINSEKEDVIRDIEHDIKESC